MVSRSAYAQLRYSPLLLAGTIVGHGGDLHSRAFACHFWQLSVLGFGVAAWCLMAIAFQPTLRLYRFVAALGAAIAAHRGGVLGLHCRFRLPALAGARRHVERARASPSGEAMSIGVEFKSGKTEHDENFPVASLLIAPRFRTPILAFYRFARAADDAADHPTLSERDKFALLDALEHTLLGKSDAAPDAIPLRGALAKTGLAARHPLELLAAFRQDVTKRRYRDWDELMQYCRYSAMPVGRFVLDVHGESQETWVSSDALCSALQVINHLQDCAKDYRTLDRVYLPLDTLDAHGASVEALAASVRFAGAARLPDLSRRAHCALDAGSRGPARARQQHTSRPRDGRDRQARERAAVAAQARDPLSERVHLSAGLAALRRGTGRRRRRFHRRMARQLFAVRPLRGAMRNELAATVRDPSARRCRREARSMSAMRILPAAQREAMYAVYAFCRAVDDIADDGGPEQERLAALDRWRRDIERLYGGSGETGLRKGCDRRSRRSDSQQADFLAVIDGMEMDVRRGHEGA